MTTNANEPTKNSLMKNKKEQLVNIILRKDAVERDLRTEIKSINEHIHEQAETIVKLTAENDTLTHKNNIMSRNISDCEDTFDEYFEQYITIKRKNRNMKIFASIFAIVAIFEFIYFYCF